MLLHAVQIVYLIALGDGLNARLIHYRLNNSFNFALYSPFSLIYSIEVLRKLRSLNKESNATSPNKSDHIVLPKKKKMIMQGKRDQRPFFHLFFYVHFFLGKERKHKMEKNFSHSQS